MKKLFILIPVILILCGCTVDYQITIKNNKISEKLVVIETNKSIMDAKLDTGFTIRESFDATLEEEDFSDDLYEYKSLSTEDQIGVEITSKAVEDLSSSSIINQCYTEPLITEKDGVVSVYTGYEFQCYEFYNNLDSVKITLKTNHKVISHNADEVAKGTYIWNLTKDGDKLIEFSYATKNSSFSFDYVLAILAIIVLIGGIVYFVKNRNKKNNGF